MAKNTHNVSESHTHDDVQKKPCTKGYITHHSTYPKMKNAKVDHLYCIAALELPWGKGIKIRRVSKKASKQRIIAFI